MDPELLKFYRSRFDTFRLIKVENVFSREEQDRILDDIEALTGVRDDDLDAVRAGTKKTYVSPGTLSRNKQFWPIIYNDNIVKLMRTFIAEDIKFQGGDALSVHWVNDGMHRDIHIDVSRGPDWDPGYSRFKIGRFLAYLNREGAQPNEFAFIPFSHHAGIGLPDLDGLKFEDLMNWAVVLRLNPGDCMVFDPRVIHTGLPLRGPKHMISLSYGSPNDHTLDAYFYGRIVRTEEGYTDLPEGLVEELRARDLYLEAMSSKEDRVRFEEKYRDFEKGDPHAYDDYIRDRAAPA